MAQTRGFSRALATVRRTVAARRDAERRARAVRIPPCSPCIVCRKNKKQHPARCCFWRRRWDSNPRGIAAKLISSQSRYDRFDTSAYSGAFIGKSSISIPEMPRGVNVSAGQIRQIRQNDAAKSAKSKNGSAARAPWMRQPAGGRVTACRPAAGRAPPKGCCSGGCTAAQFPGWAAPYRESSRSLPRRRDRRGCR